MKTTERRQNNYPSLQNYNRKHSDGATVVARLPMEEDSQSLLNDAVH